MAKHTKEEILRVAKQLFTERGYHAVSTQNIADALGISKGNLNYHFQHKADIFSAIILEMHSHYTRPAIPTSLAALDAFFLQVQEVIAGNAFYFWHYSQLSQLSEQVRQIQSDVIEDHQLLLGGAFAALRQAGSLQPEAYPGQTALIIGNLSLILVFWTPHSQLRRQLPADQGFLDSLWACIYPLLSAQGQAEYQALRTARPGTLQG